MMKIKSFEFNPISENTFVLYDETKECVIVDPGCYFEKERKELISFIKEHELIVKHLLCTHLHFDHVFGANFASETFKLPLEASKDDEVLLDNYNSQLK